MRTMRSNLRSRRGRPESLDVDNDPISASSLLNTPGSCALTTVMNFSPLAHTLGQAIPRRYSENVERGARPRIGRLG